jgi:hypothetical protein
MAGSGQIQNPQVVVDDSANMEGKDEEIIRDAPGREFVVGFEIFRRGTFTLDLTR